MYRKKKLTNGESYDDTEVRNKVIEFGKDVLGLRLKHHPKQRKIDLIGIDDPELGIEVERGGWNDDFWQTPSYCDISGLEFSTINIPIRKEKFWKEYNMWFGKLKYNVSWKKNIFVRTNKKFTQIIVIRPDVITDTTKVHYTTFQANNCDEIENWLSFKKEDVETYNLINGKYILDNEF